MTSETVLLGAFGKPLYLKVTDAHVASITTFVVFAFAAEAPATYSAVVSTTASRQADAILAAPSLRPPARRGEMALRATRELLRANCSPVVAIHRLTTSGSIPSSVLGWQQATAPLRNLYQVYRSRDQYVVCAVP